MATVSSSSRGTQRGTAIDSSLTCGPGSIPTPGGECGLETLTEADIEEGYTEEDMIEGEKAVILAPV